MKVYFKPTDENTTGSWNFYAYHAQLEGSSIEPNTFYVHNNAVFVTIDQLNKR
jgi:hypothetical protein